MERALAVAVASGHAQIVASVHWCWANAAHLHGRYDDMLAHGQAGIEHARSAGDPDSELAARHWVNESLYRSGRTEEWRKECTALE